MAKTEQLMLYDRKLSSGRMCTRPGNAGIDPRIYGAWDRSIEDQPTVVLSQKSFVGRLRDIARAIINPDLPFRRDY